MLKLKLIPKHLSGSSIEAGGKALEKLGKFLREFKPTFGLSKSNKLLKLSARTTRGTERGLSSGIELGTITHPYPKEYFYNEDAALLNKLQDQLKKLDYFKLSGIRDKATFNDVLTALENSEYYQGLDKTALMNVLKLLVNMINRGHSTKPILAIAKWLSSKNGKSVGINTLEAQKLFNSSHGLSGNFLMKYPEVFEAIRSPYTYGFKADARKIPGVTEVFEGLKGNEEIAGKTEGLFQYNGYLNDFLVKHPEYLDNPEFMAGIKLWYQQIHPNFRRGTPKREMLEYYARVKDAHGVHERLGEDFSADSIKLVLNQFAKGAKQNPKYYEVIPSNEVIQLNRFGDVLFGKELGFLKLRLIYNELAGKGNNPFYNYSRSGYGPNKVTDLPQVPNEAYGITSTKFKERPVYEFETWPTVDEKLQELNNVYKNLNDLLVAQGRTPLNTFEDGSFVRFNPKNGSFESYGMDLYKHKNGGKLCKTTTILSRKA